jgi:hypothetical protein
MVTNHQSSPSLCDLSVGCALTPRPALITRRNTYLMIGSASRSLGQAAANFPMAEGLINCRGRRCFAAAIADFEAHRATAQLLPISHVYIYESSVNIKVREALVPPPSLAKFPPISQASYIGEGLPSPFARSGAARRNPSTERSICPGVAAIVKLWANQRAGPSRNFPRAASSSVDKCRGWLRSVRKPKT